MMDRFINTPKKRFVTASTLYVLLMLQFLYGLFKVSSLFISITKTSDLLFLTTSQVKSWYWPIQLIANFLDNRFTLVNVLVITYRSIPLTFWITGVLLVYILGFDIKKGELLYRHQQRLFGFVFVSVIGVFIQILLFVYGFFAGTSASAITRVNVSGYVGIGLSVGLSLISIIILCLLWLDASSNNEI